MLLDLHFEVGDHGLEVQLFFFNLVEPELQSGLHGSMHRVQKLLNVLKVHKVIEICTQEFQ